MDLLVLVLASSATALATGLGALPVSRLGERAEQLRPALWGLTAGVMGVASVVGLLLPALEQGGTGTVAAGLAAGAVFLLSTRRLLGGHEFHIAGVAEAGARRSAVIFTVLLVHSLPEGFAIGTAYASDTAGLGLFVILAIGLQNVPEGTAVAIPMEAAGFGPARQFWAAVGTSAPQPVGAVLAYGLVSAVDALLAFSFGFAAGAMLALVAVEVAPQAVRSPGRAQALAGALAGAGVMLTLAALLGA